ncbi:hypothetical protein TCDM_08524 [Trypanosoma cruzi Dm28c]|uniref:Uncharacterized protein n=1 Tax=Trypanosoma cruzi Dm28c TaxID=1416333 RepID=V5B7Q7_TRYCR|nr:hypothetical protein TCDM_08524 [Trypanosoma cruzi Dm28c]
MQPASAPCSRRRPNHCHPLIHRVAPRPVRLQRPPVPIAILLLHAIHVVAVVVLPRCHRGSRRVHHHQQRPATHTGSIPHHAAACHVRAGKPDSMGHQVRGEAGGEASVKQNCRAMFMAPATGRPSSSVAHGSAHTTPFLQPNTPSNAFAVQHQEQPQCLLLSHGHVVGALVRTGTHRSLQTTLHTCNASCAPRGTSPTTPGDAHTPPARTASSMKQGYVRTRAGHPPAIHIAGIITSSSSSAAGRGERGSTDAWRMWKKKRNGLTRMQEAETSTKRMKRYENTRRRFKRPQSMQATDKKGGMSALNHNASKTLKNKKPKRGTTSAHTFSLLP